MIVMFKIAECDKIVFPRFMQSHTEKSQTAKINNIIISARSRSVICIRLALDNYLAISL